VVTTWKQFVCVAESTMRCKTETLDRLTRAVTTWKQFASRVTQCDVKLRPLNLAHERQPHGNSLCCVAESTMRCKTETVNCSTRAATKWKQFVLLRGKHNAMQNCLTPQVVSSVDSACARKSHVSPPRSIYYSQCCC
jgi:hypothetical protein